MKKNEPVRTGGIGRKQIAWQSGKAISEGSAIQDLINQQSEQYATQSNEAQNIATLAQADAHARAIAYSAANATASANQNDIWSTQSIQQWTHNGSAGNESFSYIKWANPDPDNLSNIRSPLAYVDSEDPTIIRVNRSGWYMVSVNFYQGDHSLNNHRNELTVVSSDSPDTTTAKTRIESHGYPSLSLCQLVPVPGYFTTDIPVPNEPQDVHNPGLQTVYLIGPHSGNITITPANSYASIQIVWLRPFEANFFYNGA